MKFVSVILGLAIFCANEATARDLNSHLRTIRAHQE